MQFWPVRSAAGRDTTKAPDLAREHAMKRNSKVVAASPAKTSSARCEYTGSARDFFPQKISLTTLRDSSKTCRGCDLYCNATQTVFGAGPASATLMLVGEQ